GEILSIFAPPPRHSPSKTPALSSAKPSFSNTDVIGGSCAPQKELRAGHYPFCVRQYLRKISIASSTTSFVMSSAGRKRMECSPDFKTSRPESKSFRQTSSRPGHSSTPQTCTFLPNASRSGCTLNCWQHQVPPVVQSPVCTSAKISRISLSSQISRNFRSHSPRK